MTNSMRAATAGPTPHTVQRARRGPPGILFYATTVLAIAIALDANSRGSLLTALLAGMLWLVIVATWFVRFWAAHAPSATRMPTRDWIRWLAIPVALGAVFALTRTDAVKEARFDLSRGALDRMAADVMAGGSADRGWVGLYDIGSVELTANGFWFVLADDGLSRIGLAYAPVGEPRESEENFSPLWQPAEFEHLDGPWWTFAQRWD